MRQYLENGKCVIITRQMALRLLLSSLA